MVTVRFGLLALFCVVILSACGENPLAGFGVTDEWLGDRGDGTVRTVTSDTIAVQPEIGSLVWYNPPVSFVPDDPDLVIDTIWERSTGTDAFVQAAPNEMSAVLAGLKVPRYLPTGTEHVTSQLVYGVSSGRLTNSYVAAFGFWKSEPYTSSRSVSQILQMKVAEDLTDPAPAVDDDTLGCVRFNRLDVTSCEPVGVSAARAWWVGTRDGPVLIWYDAGFRYELLDRQKLGRDALVDLARSMILLQDVSTIDQNGS